MKSRLVLGIPLFLLIWTLSCGGSADVIGVGGLASDDPTAFGLDGKASERMIMPGVTEPDLATPDVVVPPAEIDPDLRLDRLAIYKCLDIGKQLLVQSLNAVGSRDNPDFRFVGPEDGGEVVAPPVREEVACPFVQAASVDATRSCRWLADQALNDAYANMASALALFPLGPEFQNSNADSHDNWYREGMMYGALNSSARSVRVLKAQGACDQVVTPAQDAFERGVALGRYLYQGQINASLRANGWDFVYPASVEAGSRITT
jgi:hypothetical protein